MCRPGPSARWACPLAWGLFGALSPPFAGRTYSRYTRAPAGDFLIVRQVLTYYRKETVVAEKIMHEALNVEAGFVLGQLVVLWFARSHVLRYFVCQLLF